ncbi:MAG TPA: hydantoinase B/oxoprolinase family protein [Steroidobacteraceae bacterium]|nr:hydantoinase B/oxoprolinase family protein [Steroidobacteraceae bacterium]
MPGWQFWIDRGGTFTDVIGVAPDGRLHVHKALSSAAGELTGDVGLGVIRSILEGARSQPAGGTSAQRGTAITALKVGTTVATNALLERTGEPVLLVTTAGFADALAIGDQSRPDIFAQRIVLPDRLHVATIEAHERIGARGEVLTPLDGERLRGELAGARARGLRSVAIVFLHAWRYPQHERQAAAIAREIGFGEVSVSHELSPVARYVPRASTTVLNAYLAPTLASSLSGLQRALESLGPGASLELMQSHGGLAGVASVHAASSLLSGPAGGAIAARKIAGRLGITRLVSFDMGGTSTDVALLDGELPRREEHALGGVRVQTSMLDVHTIAAGGGSVLRFRDGRASVGPDSAGANPGPTCYGRGGPLTLTDVQVLLGRLRPDTLPRVFGMAGTSSIDRRRVLEQLTALAADVAAGARVEELAESYLEVAVAAMSNAIRRVATQGGVDPATLTLFAFGGAAGQHACRVARAAGIRRILIHPLASVLSAYGIGVADRCARLRESARMPLNAEALAAAAERLAGLEREARSELASGTGTRTGTGETGADSHDGDAAARVQVARWLEIRAGDSETALTVPFASRDEIERTFSSVHRRRFGFDPAGLEARIEALCVEARVAAVDVASLRAVPAPSAELPATAPVWFSGWRDVPLVRSDRLQTAIRGPALIVEPHSTFVVEPGWVARPLPGGEILAENEPRRSRRDRRTAALATAARIEIFNNLFMHVAEQMGEVLRQTAQSVNIKERLDYSCALFDPHGGLVANAPHMPVHLGSMGATVRAVIEAHRNRMQPGDAWLLNSPYHGGTHLPDMTVVSPIFLDAGGARTLGRMPDFFVASRAHHADIGGITPGSMPATSRRIEEEGVVFEDFKLVAGGTLRRQALEDRLRDGPHPARNPAQNLADLRAQLAANARGAAELTRAVHELGLEAVRTGMIHVQRNAAGCVRRAIEQLRPGAFRYEMDGGQTIAVRIEIDRARGAARVDFTGTSPQGDHNFNAPRAVCVAAVLYVFRTLVDRPIPLNEGCLEPLELVIPPGSMLDPRPPAAVAAGNVETSQCIVDALYGALGALAASQGTMNNLTFGDETLQYYETVAGGSGAGPAFDGCDAVQTHMTNSRLTDPEILEERFPVLVREFRIRRGSGGGGAYRGGDGIVRRLQFRAPLSGSLLSNRRRVPPFGLAGGCAGATGAARILRVRGGALDLGATASFLVQAGDELELLTPGGGGYGRPGSGS